MQPIHSYLSQVIIILSLRKLQSRVPFKPPYKRPYKEELKYPLLNNKHKRAFFNFDEKKIPEALLSEADRNILIKPV